MADPLNKARKHVAVWSETAELLKTLSEVTRRSQIELLFEAVYDLATKVRESDTVLASPAKETRHE